jgi:hypothetical protein
MTTTDWIVCERSTRWAAALRMTISSDSEQPAGSNTLREVRSIAELTGQLKSHPSSLVLIEVTQDNFDGVLNWLAATTRRANHTPAVALVSWPTDNRVRSSTDVKDRPSQDRDAMAAALREAGALDVIDSPRRLRPVLALGRRHAGRCSIGMDNRPDASPSFEDWAWSLLPWQDAARPVG